MQMFFDAVFKTCKSQNPCTDLIVCADQPHDRRRGGPSGGVQKDACLKPMTVDTRTACHGKMSPRISAALAISSGILCCCCVLDILLNPAE